MPSTLATQEWLRRRGPELLLALMASVVFLGFLGSVDLWGKREQRASAEAIDTIDHSRWLVARIQGRPRLEKPPLPRWTIASLMTLTGRRDEWMVRLPSACSALGMVALAYAFGRRIGGRSVGLASGLALCSMVFFITELRQAGNDGPLAFFTTLAIYAAWRRLHDESGALAEDAAAPGVGGRGWNFLLYGAMGLGFLTKGPIVVLVVMLTVVPYLALARRLKWGMRRLADGWGALTFLVLALSWPVPVILSDPKAVQVWMLEMGQKAGTAGIAHTRWRPPLAADWPWMTLPWAIMASVAVVRPWLKQGRADRGRTAFVWWWVVGNLVMFCFWAVAKPNYYVPCLPGVAILVGYEWVRMTRMARGDSRDDRRALRILQLHWVLLLIGAVVLPALIYRRLPSALGWGVACSLAMVAGVFLSIARWRRGAEAGVLAPLVGALTMVVAIGYGEIGPGLNARYSHRALAATLDQILPPDVRTIRFFHELDEGLWFYLRDRELVAVPGSQAAYNDALQLSDDLKHNRVEWDWMKRVEAQKKLLLSWIDQPDRDASYLLIREKDYTLFAPALVGRAEPLHREQNVGRNALMLLRLTEPAQIARKPEGDRPH